MKDYMALLGHKVKDKVTGFVGVVTSVSFDLYGCVQCIVQPGAGKEGKMEDSRWFDFKRLVKTSQARTMTPMLFDPQIAEERGPAEKPRHPAA